MSVVLDTCVLSEFIRPAPDAGVLSWFERQDRAELFLSVLSLGEIEKGIGLLPPDRRRTAVQKWLATLRSTYAARVLAVDEETALIWGRLHASSVRKGRPLATVDGLIAATALRHGYAVVTRNETDFEPSGVPLVNPWRSA